ncbi:dynamin family protein [Catenuloplanes sp. NPDC051500]|uniref:dynamin family protein n=1 Tax=Catenuloplanes sp. NPDC051500 TaxID=3363959 RepID=UPI003797431A
MPDGPRVTDLPAVGEHFALAQRLTDLFPSGDARRDEWRARIDRARERIADRGHRVAVIGEFSSGKTTLINALLGAEVFPVSARPTTSAAVRISYGARPEVRALFKDGSEWRSDSDDVLGALKHLTTGDDLAPQVTAVELRHPARLLRDGLVIVDTPGTNAEDGHSEIARQAVLDADAALIVLSAGRLMPATLADFLTATLDPHLLSRCLYVVTRMDEVDEDADRVRTTAVQRIRSMLDDPDPAVAFCAPGAAVRARRGVPLSDEQARWSARFAALPVWLTTAVGDRRPAAAADTALRLVDGLLAGLDEALAEDRAAAGRQERALDAAGLTDLDAFLREQRRPAGRELRDARAAARVAVDRLCAAALESARDGVRTTLRNCAGTAAMETALRGAVPDLVRRELDGLADRAAAEVRAIFTAKLDAATGIVQTAFAREYARLRRAGVPKIDVPAAARVESDRLVLTGTFGAAVAVTVEDQSRDKKAFGFGAGAGAAIGTLIFPGVGTVVGGLLGLVAGAAFARDLEEVRAEATASAIATAEAVFGEAATKLTEAVDVSAGRADTALADHLGWYRDSYRQTVAAARADQQARRAALRDRADRLAASRTETVAHRARLDQARTRLSGKARR